MTNVAQAKAIFRQDPHVRVLMDNGAGPQGPGSIGATWELGFSAWPPKEAKANRYYLGPNGSLSPQHRSAATAQDTPAHTGRPRHPHTGNARVVKIKSLL